jgi:hypothetical protein
MALGPFVTYVPPGVYTRTLTESNVAQLVAGLRLPIIIGVGQEELNQDNVALVRGSSATVDQQISNEDVSLSWVVSSVSPNNLVLGAQDGTLVQFRVRNFPLVDGQGLGRVTNDIRTVSVTVNGLPSAVAQVVGQRGLVTLQVPTQPTDIVRVTYYFHRGDTAFLDDVSQQVTVEQAALTSPGYEPFAVTMGLNDLFTFEVNGALQTLTLSAGALTASSIKSQIDSLGISNLTTSVFTDNEGRKHLSMLASQELLVLNGSANGPLGFANYTKTGRNATFTVFNRPITDGAGSGLTTTDPAKVVVKVNNVQVVASAVDGQNGTVTLPTPPASGSLVTVNYFANTWQDTFDYLPNTLVTQVVQCGIAPNRADYIQGTDFVVSNPSQDVSIIHWGTSYSVAAASTTVGGTPFDNTQIVGTLNDDKMYLGECERYIDSTTIPATVSTTDFLLPEVPTMGNGRNTTLGLALYNAVTNGRQDLITNRPDLVAVYVGRNLRDATARPAVKVLTVDGTTRRISLQSQVPPDYNAYATFYYNRVSDDSYLFTNKVAGPVGTGQYHVFSTLLNSNLYQTRFGTKAGLPETVQWPRGAEQVPDAFHTGAGTPVSETITVTFDQSDPTNAEFTNKGAEPYSLYRTYSDQWITKLNGTNYTTALSIAAPACMVSRGVMPIQSGPDTGSITIASGSEVLKLEIDGTPYTINLTNGNRTPTQIVGEINTAVGSPVASFVQVGGTPGKGDVYFLLTSTTTPSALPSGFDSPSKVYVAPGSVENVLGFKTYASVTGTSGAINKPATLIGTVAGPFAITTGLNDTFKVQVDGIEYTVSLPAGAAVTPAAVAGAINAVIPSVASVGTLGNLNQIRLTSPTNVDTSNLIILGGTANDLLGFVQNQIASQSRVSAQEIVNRLNATAGFQTRAVAHPQTLQGATYITITSLTTGLTASKIEFVSSGSTTSAFNTTTGLRITPSVDGDNGEDASDIFVVSSDNSAGSSGTGAPGQTYTDARTSLRFTILPAATGSYTIGGQFTMQVSPTFNVNPAIPFYSVAGMELTVSNTVGVVPEDTGRLQTFAPGGVEPANGDPYYLSYKYLKQDYTTRIFRQLKTIEANFGRTSGENRVTLAAYLAILNGSLLVGIKQVLKVSGTNQANDASFIAALNELATPLPGNVKPDIIIPLATSTAVYAQLTQHVETQSLIQNQSERMGFIGFASGTSPSTAATIASSLNSNRIVCFYPDSVVVTLTDELGQSYDSLVDGTFLAASMAGAVVSPAVDVATPYTRRRVQGFTRIPRILDPVEANQTAVKGVTLLEDLDPIIRVRQGLTTRMDSALTRLPTVTQIADYVQQQSRIALDNFIGTKFLATRTQEVNVTMTSLFKQLVQAEIVAAFTGINSAVDPNDPTVLRFEAYYQPVFPLLYIILSFNLRAQL